MLMSPNLRATTVHTRLDQKITIGSTSNLKLVTDFTQINQDATKVFICNQRLQYANSNAEELSAG